MDGDIDDGMMMGSDDAGNDNNDETSSFNDEEIVVVPTPNSIEHQQHGDSENRHSGRRRINLGAASDGDKGLHGKDSEDHVAAALNIMAHHGGDRIPQDHNDDHHRWEDISFDSSGKDSRSLARSENTHPEDSRNEENNLLSAVARWLQIAPKTEDNEKNQPSPSEPFFSKESTVLGEEIVSKQETESDPVRKSVVSPAVKWWWTSLAQGNEQDEDEWLGTEDDTSHNDAKSITSHDSDADGSAIDYDETTAELMASALDWLRTDDQQVDEGSVASSIHSAPYFGSENDGSDGHHYIIVPSLPSIRTPEQRSLDLEKVVQWMKKGKGKGQTREDKYDPTKEYRKLESMLPKRKGMTPEERAIEIEGALDWLRNHEEELLLSVGEEDNRSNSAVNTINWNNFGPAPICVTRPEDRLQELQNVIIWIRNKGKGKKNKLDPNGNFRKVDRLLPRRKGQKLEDRGREIEGVMDWMRNSELIPKETNTLSEIEKLERFHVSRRTPEQRIKDLNDVMLWMSQSEGDDRDENVDPAGHFGRLNLILEVKEGQSSEDRARDIECSLDWFRHNDGNDSSSKRSRGGRKRRSRRGSRRRRRRTPSPGKPHRKRNPEARIPKIIGGRPLAAEPNLLASIGRVVNIVAPPPSDVSTVGTSKHPSDQKAVLIEKAQHHTIEMASAIAFLVEPAPSAEAPSSSPGLKAGTDIFGGADEHWWESPDVNTTNSIQYTIRNTSDK